MAEEAKAPDSSAPRRVDTLRQLLICLDLKAERITQEPSAQIDRLLIDVLRAGLSSKFHSLKQRKRPRDAVLLLRVHHVKRAFNRAANNHVTQSDCRHAVSVADDAPRALFHSAQECHPPRPPVGVAIPG